MNKCALLLLALLCWYPQSCLSSLIQSAKVEGGDLQPGCSKKLDKMGAGSLDNCSGDVRGRDIPEFSQYFGTTHAACRL